MIIDTCKRCVLMQESDGPRSDPKPDARTTRTILCSSLC